MLSLASCLLSLAVQLPQGSTVSEVSWTSGESTLAQREATATLIGDDVVWTRTATQNETVPSGLYVDLFRTQRVDPAGQVLWTDTVYGATASEGEWPESLGRLPESWPIDPSRQALLLAVPADRDLVLRSLDVADGTLLWEQRFEAEGTDEPFYFVHDAFYDGANDQFLVVSRRLNELDVRAVQAGSGNVNWIRRTSISQGLPFGFAGATIRPDSAFVPGSAGLVAAAVQVFQEIPRAQIEYIDVQTGDLIWSNVDLFAEELGLALSPDGGRLAVATNGGPGPRIAQFQTSTGQFQWQRASTDKELDRDPEAWFDPTGERVFASFSYLRDNEIGGSPDMGAQLNCVVSATGELVWSNSRAVDGVSGADRSFSPDLAFPLAGEALWSYGLPITGGFVTHRERLSLTDGSTLFSVDDSAEPDNVYPDASLGLDAVGDLVVLGRRPTGTLKQDQLAYVHRLVRLDPMSLIGGAGIESQTLGADGSSLLAIDVSDDGSRGVALATSGVEGVQRLVGFDVANNTVLWNQELSQLLNAGGYILDLDPLGNRVVVVRSSALDGLFSGFSMASVYDMDTGTLLWEQPYGDVGLGGGPQQSDGDKEVVLTNNELVLLSPAGNSLDLAVLEPTSGALRWSRNLDYNSNSTRVLDVYDGSVYALNHEGTVQFFKAVVRLMEYDLATGAVLAEFPLGDFAFVEDLAVKSEGVFVGRFFSGQTSGLLISSDLSTVEQELSGLYQSVLKLGPGEGFLRVGSNALDQVGDLLEPGEDPETLNWILTGVGAGPGAAVLFEEGRQLFVQNSLQAQSFTSQLDYGIDLERGQIMWSGLNAIAGDQDWEIVRLANTALPQLFAAYTAKAPGNPTVPFTNALRTIQLPELIVNSEGLVASEGNRVDLFLRGRTEPPGQTPDLYAVLASFELATPGLPAGAFEVPFPATDPLVFCSLSGCSPGVLQDFQGSLSSEQLGYAAVDPQGMLGPELIGQDVHFTWVQIDGDTLAVELVAPVVTLTLD